MSYQFTSVNTMHIKNYERNLDVKRIEFTNNQDSTYNLSINIYENSKTAMLMDYKKKVMIGFQINFDYQQIEDLNKLKNPILFTSVKSTKDKEYKNAVEEVEAQIDSADNQKTIVHTIKYKNDQKKKIVYESYSFFDNNAKLNNDRNVQFKNYLVDQYHLNQIKNQYLEKILILYKGKIDKQIDFLDFSKTDFKFEFKIEETMP
ncbi:MAG: hypothetical protein U0X58_07130 [Flavobacteriaceae bacterium]